METLAAGGPPKGGVPFLEIHGTADKVSRYEGLHVPNYWGEYLAVTDAVRCVEAANIGFRTSKDVVRAKSVQTNTSHSHTTRNHAHDSAASLHRHPPHFLRSSTHLRGQALTFYITYHRPTGTVPINLFCRFKKGHVLNSLCFSFPSKSTRPFSRIDTKRSPAKTM